MKPNGFLYCCDWYGLELADALEDALAELALAELLALAALVAAGTAAAALPDELT
jgi:hypothetical protein